MVYQQCMYADGNQILGAGCGSPPPAGYGPPPTEEVPLPYAFTAPPDIVPIPGTYVYFVPGIGVDIFFY